MPQSVIQGDRSADSAQLESAVVAEQVRLLIKKRVDLPINILNACIVSGTLWKLYPIWIVVSWLISFCIVILARALIRRHYSATSPRIEDAKRWGIIFAVNAFTTACLWGLTGSVVLVSHDPVNHMFIIFVLAGMMAGGIVTNSAYTPAMLAFMVPTILPIIILLVTGENTTQIEMGVMLAIFATILVITGLNINQSVVVNFRLRIAQDILLSRVRASEAAMATAQELAHVGSFELNILTQQFSGSLEAYRIFDLDPDTFNPTFAAILARVHPDDLAMVKAKVATAVTTKESHEIWHRIVRDSGEIRYVHEITLVNCDSDGEVLGFVGTLEDVTEQRKGEVATALLAAIVDSSVDAIAAESVDGIITSWNKSAEALYGYRADEIIGKSVRIIIPEGRAHELDENLAVLARGGSVKSFDTERLRKDGSSFPVSIAVSTILDVTGKVVGGSFISRDITERNEAAAELAYRDRLLHAVTAGISIVVSTESIEEGLPEALGLLGETMRADRVVVMEESSRPLTSPVQRYAWQRDAIGVPFDMSAFVVAPEDIPILTTWRVQMMNGKPLIAQLATSEGPVRKMLEHFHNKSTVLVPIFVKNRMWGTLAVDSCSAARDWTTSETETMKTFGDMAGALIVRNETRLLLESSEERFRVLAATAQDAIILMDGAGRVSSWNLAAERILGYSAEEAIGRKIHDFLTPERFKERADEGMSAFVATGKGSAIDKTTLLAAIRKDGTEIAIELSLAGARVGTEWQAIGILRDITDRQLAEAKLQFANILLTTELEGSPDGILVVDEKRAIISYNQRFADIWNVPLKDLIEGNDDVVLAQVLLAVKSPDKFLSRVLYLYDHPQENSHDEYETNDSRFIDRYSVALFNPSGEYLGRVWFFRDVSESKKSAAHALRMARFDVLTGLANRSVFVEALNHQIASAKRGEKGLAVVYLDLDHFKDVNDTLGHPVGDALLQAVAERLQQNTRASDTVARFGGDEFAVVVADVGDPADAAMLAEKLINALADPYSIQGNDIYSGASIGIDLYGPEASDAETLLSHADVALYRAKSEGRSGYRFFTDAMDEEVRTQVSLGTELHEALKSGQLFLLYQPQVALDTGKIVGVEALVRWHHPKRGILGPDIFIPVAEKIGLIVKLGHWVLLTACQQAKAWFDAGITPIRTAVNLSALQFKSPIALEADIADILHKSGLSPHLLELELTETVLMNASREHKDIILRLREIGVTIAIDDFGTGYSSLDYLRRFPADRIKIAQTFVRQLETMPGNVTIVKATISLGRELGITIIAEGVETQQQLELLKAWGCPEIQGYYSSRPLTVEAITTLLHTGKLFLPGTSQLAQ